MSSQFETNLKMLFGSLDRPVVSPFCEGEDKLFPQIASAPADAVLFLDVPRADFPMEVAHAAAAASGRPFVLGHKTNSAAVRKSLRSLGLNLFQVSGSEGSEGHVFGTPQNLGGHPALVPVSAEADPRLAKDIKTPAKIQLRKSRLLIFDNGEDVPVEKRIVTGVAMAANEADVDGEFFSPETVHEAMVNFMLWYRNIGLEHVVDINEDTDIVECWQLREPMVVDGKTVPAGSWMMSLKIWSHRLWEALKNGSLAGFSIGGDAFEISEEMVDIPAA
jgi:hypothetical protein